MGLKTKNHPIGGKLISNTVYLFLDWFVLAFFSFIFWLILGKSLSPLDVGITATAISLIISISNFSSLGINNALQKLIPEIKEKKGLKGVYSLVKSSTKPLLISLLIISLILLLFSNQFSSLVKIPHHAFLICIFSIIVISIYNLLGSVLYGLQKMRRYFLTDFVQVVLRVLFTGLLIFLGFSFLGPLIGFLFACLCVLSFRLSSDYFTNGKSPSYKKLFFYASPALISNIASILINRGEYIILTILKNPEITGIFAIAFTITSVIAVLPGTLNSGLFPIISALSIDKKTKKKQGYLIGLVLRYSMFLVIPSSLLLLIFSKQAVLLFSKPEFLPSTIYFPILIPGAILYGIGIIFYSDLYAIGKPKISRNIMVLSSLLFLTLSLILTNYFSALGLSISYLVAMLVLFSSGFIYIKKFVKLNLFTRDLLKILLSSLAIISILFIFKPFIQNVFVLGIILLPTSLLYLGILLFTKFYRIEDVKILRYFGKRTPNIGKHVLSIADFIEKRLC